MLLLTRELLDPGPGSTPRGFLRISTIIPAGTWNRLRVNVLPGTIMPDSDRCVCNIPGSPISACSPQLPNYQTLHNPEWSVVCCPIDCFLCFQKRTCKSSKIESNRETASISYNVEATSVHISDQNGLICLKSRGHSRIEHQSFLMRLRRCCARESSSVNVRGA